MTGPIMPDTSDDPDDPSRAERKRQRMLTSIGEGMIQFAPHNLALGMKFVSFEDGRATVSLPYDDKLVGNPLTGVLAGGAITALMDTTCGAAVFIALREPMRIATLDLRIDYLRPATPKLEVYARAHCFRVAREVAFVRCEAYHAENEKDPVAVANGTFILFPNTPASSRKAKAEGKEGGS
jgi:uncharacterized protein (TIGR00369 family)